MRNRWDGPWSTHSSLRSRRIPGSIFHGTRAWPSSRRSVRAETDQQNNFGGSTMLTRRHLLATAGAAAWTAAASGAAAQNYASQPIHILLAYSPLPALHIVATF